MTDLSLFSGAQAALLARCHRRSTLAEATAAVRDALNDTPGVTAGPAHAADPVAPPSTAFTIVHNGLRYRLTVRPETEDIHKPTIE